jgi:hypothetical protein
MNRKKVNLVAAQDIASNVGDQDDAICIAGFQALLLHPYIFPCSLLQKNEAHVLHEWRRAEELGISGLADADHPWASGAREFSLGSL